MRGRLSSFVVGFFLKTFKHWGVVEASEEELEQPRRTHRANEGTRRFRCLNACPEYLDEWCDEEHRYLTKVYNEEKEEYRFPPHEAFEKAPVGCRTSGHAAQGVCHHRVSFQPDHAGDAKPRSRSRADPEARLGNFPPQTGGD